jgi:uncharacterized membrane protein
MAFVIFGSFKFTWIGKTAAQAYITQMSPVLKCTIVVWLIGSYIMHRIFLLGFTRICLEIYDHNVAQVHDLWGSWYLIAKDMIIRLFTLLLLCVPLLFAPIGQVIAVGMHLTTPMPILIVGLVFLYIVIFFLLLRLSFTQQILVDKEVSAVSAIIMSYRLTQSVWFKLSAFWLVITVLNLIGYVSGFGFIFTLSISYLAHVFVYRSLLGNNLQGSLRA